MRIRSIKPEFWRSPDVSSLTPIDRLLFIGLWSYVDDNGVGLDRESNIAADLFADDLSRDSRETLARVADGLEHLSAAGRVVRYSVGDHDYLEIVNWDRHQRIDRPNKPRFPRNDAEDSVIRDTLATPSRDPRETPATGTGEQGNRGTGEQTTPNGVVARAKTATATRIPDGFTVTDEMRDWAARETPGLDADRITAGFVDYWRAKPGQAARKLDWTATWRNWMRREDTQPRKLTPTQRAHQTAAAGRVVAGRVLHSLEPMEIDA